MGTKKATLDLKEINEILTRHHTSKTELAAQLGIRPQSLSCWLAGRTTSSRIAEAAQRKAAELLAAEKDARKGEKG